MSKIKKNRIIIFHFLPIELYPPIINFINYVSNSITSEEALEVVLFTTRPNSNLELVEFNNVKIVRFKAIDSNKFIFSRVFHYVYIYLTVLFNLVISKPKSIFYYESLSSLPIVIYRFFNSKFNLYIHYHELFTLKQLEKGRALHKLFSKLEVKYLYSNAIWISQTNSKRMEIFLQQHHLDFNPKQHKCLPNYPSKEWLANKEEKHLEDYEKRKDVTKLVHIGALSFNDMYLNEVLETFGNNDKFELHFYSHATNKEIINKLESFNNVSFMGSINYNAIPNLRLKYDIGLVLYKGNSLNFTYNAPNKIFEYLALDLDVWCSKKLITAFDYVIEDTYPKMLMVDYENLPTLNVNALLSREGLVYKSTPYYCEAVYKPLLNSMCTEIKA